MSPLRNTLAAHLGQVLTPEVAAAIERVSQSEPKDVAIGTPAKESYSDCSAEAAVLNALHWSETYGHAGYRADHGGISDMESNGGFLYYTLRSHSHELMGHVAFFITHSPTNGAAVAVDSFYYILPKFRGSLGMSKLLRFAANDMTDRGIKNIIVSHKASNGIGKIIERAGFSRSGETFTFNRD